MRLALACLLLLGCSDGATVPDAAATDATTADASDDATSDALTCTSNPKSDPHNCGSCAHDCLGGTCLEGVCQPVVIAEAQQEPVSVALYGGWVYWLTSLDGALWRAPRSGGTVEKLATLTRYGPSRVAVDSTGVYFTSSGTLYTTGLDGGAPALIAKVAQQNYFYPASPLALDDSRVYVAAASGIAWVPKAPSSLDGGAPPSLMVPTRPIDIRLEDGQVYWYDLKDIHSVPTDAGLDAAPDTGVATAPVVANGIAVDTNNVYATDPTHGEILSIPRGGGAPTVLSVGRDQPSVMTVDSSTVYWVDGGTGDILSCVLPACAGGARVVVPAQPTPNALAVDDTSLCWTTKWGGTVACITK
jgi:hypothetical protein